MRWSGTTHRREGIPSPPSETGRGSGRLRCRSEGPSIADITDVDSPKRHVIVDFGKSASLERKDPLLGLEWCLR